MLRKLEAITGSKQLRWLTIMLSIVALFEGVTLAMLLPFLRAFMSPEGSAERESLLPLTVLICVMGLITFVFSSWVSMFANKVSVYSVSDNMIREVAGHALKLPLGWFTARREALLATIMSREINSLSHVAPILLPALTSQFIVPSVLIISLLFVDWRLSLVMVIAVPLLYLGWKFMARNSVAADQVEAKAATTSAGKLIEFAKLQPVLRASGVTRAGWEPLKNALAAENHALLSSMRSKGRPILLYTLIVDVMLAATLITGYWLINAGRIDVPVFLAAAVIAIRITQPLSSSVVYSDELHKANNALDQVHEVLDADPLPIAANPVTERTGTAISFNNISFGYNPERPVLQNIDFVAEPGKITALVGGSGTGKSTLLRLAARFWDVDSGSVTIGGDAGSGAGGAGAGGAGAAAGAGGPAIDVREFDPEALMGKIAMVFQEVYLFDTTIRENVRMAKPEATDDELDRAARLSRLDSVIAKLPDGWDTKVGHGGLKLSGGERQRVAIARAFIKDAPILLLDEITSALDSENEAAITEVMQELSRGRTVIVVAHRLSTIRDANKIVVLKPGLNGAPATVGEIGTYEELVSRPGIFSDFVAASKSASSWQV